MRRGFDKSKREDNMKVDKNILAVVTLAFAAFLGSGGASAQVVALGASNTEGYGVGSSSAYPAQLEAMLRAKGRPMRVSNAGVYGDTTSGMLSRLSSDVPAGTRVVILQFGGNDMRRGVSPQERQANIAQIQAQLRARGIRTVQADGAVLGALRSGLKQADGVHLTEEGHRRVAASLLSSVR